MSRRLTPESSTTLEKVFEADGWKFSRQKGSHRMYTKQGYMRPLVIPVQKEIHPGIIRGLLRTAQMDRRTYFELLDCV